MHQADITDFVRLAKTRKITRIEGFYRICIGTRTPTFPRSLAMVPCDFSHPDLVAVGVSDPTLKIYPPWEIEWMRPQKLGDDERAQLKADYTDRVRYEDAIFNEMFHPEIFEEFSAPSNHARLEVQSWRQDTHWRIEAFLDEIGQ
jgi:hypothetical protein